MIRMSVAMFNGAIFDAYERGIARGRVEVEQRVTDSTRALVAENSRLKIELGHVETRAMVAIQKASFVAVREEQLRIKTAIERYDEKLRQGVSARELLFAIVLGDVQ